MQKMQGAIFCRIGASGSESVRTRLMDESRNPTIARDHYVVI